MKGSGSPGSFPPQVTAFLPALHLARLDAGASLNAPPAQFTRAASPCHPPLQTPPAPVTRLAHCRAFVGHALPEVPLPKTRSLQYSRARPRELFLALLFFVFYKKILFQPEILTSNSTAKSMCPNSIQQRKGPGTKSISVIAKVAWYKINFIGSQLSRKESELIRIPGFVPCNVCRVLLQIQPSRQNRQGR